MTVQERIAELRRLHEEATAGPWGIETHSGNEGWLTLMRGAWDISHNRAELPGVVADSRYSAMSTAENRANAEVIKATRNLLPVLLAAWELAQATEDASRASMAKDAAQLHSEVVSRFRKEGDARKAYRSALKGVEDE